MKTAISLIKPLNDLYLIYFILILFQQTKKLSHF